MRWVYRAFTALGVLALAAALVYGIVTQVRLHQRVGMLEENLRLVCDRMDASSQDASSSRYAEFEPGPCSLP